MADPDRLVRARDLVGASDIAERLGMARPQTVHTWRSRELEFPDPVVVISRVAIWAWPDVERWAHETGRLGPWSRE